MDKLGIDKMPHYPRNAFQVFSSDDKSLIIIITIVKIKGGCETDLIRL